MVEPASAETVGWRPACDCGEEATRPCVVLDPFVGSGRSGVMARRLGRQFIGIELNPTYADMARRNIESYHKRPVRPGPEMEGQLTLFGGDDAS